MISCKTAGIIEASLNFCQSSCVIYSSELPLIIVRCPLSIVHYQFKMKNVTQILSAIENGDAHAAQELLPLVYDELRKLAAAKLANEKPGQTIQATGLVHEAWIRLLGSDAEIHWNGRGHFFGAAAKAMQRLSLIHI